jgi:hypothetical protein
MFFEGAFQWSMFYVDMVHIEVYIYAVYNYTRASGRTIR